VVQSSVVSTKRFNGSNSHDNHATDKEHSLDPQTEGANKGQSARQQGGQDTATSEESPQHSTQKAKKDHPKAPEPIIGMQDERGGKGH